MADNKLQIHVFSGSRPAEQVIVLEGVMNADTAFEFRDLVRNEQQDAASLVLDMSQVRSMDSSGLGVLIGTYASFERSGRRLLLAGINDRIWELFRMCKIEDVFTRYPTIAAAEEALPASVETAVPS